MDMTGIEPWDICGSCHGVDGDGNSIKFPRLAGQRPEYLIKQLTDFRMGRRRNDGSQMQASATELGEADLKRVAEWFASQTPPWPQPTMNDEVDLSRIRKLVVEGSGSVPACRSCHHSKPAERAGPSVVAPRIAGQRDFYIAKQLADFRTGERDNDAGKLMRRIANGLSAADIAGLAMYLSQNPELHEQAQ